MIIIVDTREQRGYDFRAFGVETVRAALPTGDYSVQGLEDLVSVERKSPDDLVQCLGRERPRFWRELERLRQYEAAALVVECPFSAIRAGHYRSAISPRAAVQSLIAVEAGFRLPIHFARDRLDAEAFVFDFLRHYKNARERRTAQKASQDGETPLFNNKTRQQTQEGA